MTDRAVRRRRLGVSLVAFGATGIGLILLAAILVLGSLSALANAATDFERQRTEIVALLGPASDALADAATSASNAGSSVAATAAAATRGAQLTSRLADSFDSLASVGSFEILGARPFAASAAQFAAVSADARALSADLTTTAASMQTNVSDSVAVAADLRSLAYELDRLEATLGTGSGAPATGTGAASAFPIDLARLILIGLLVWLAVPAVASLWAGARLIRASRG